MWRHYDSPASSLFLQAWEWRCRIIGDKQSLLKVVFCRTLPVYGHYGGIDNLSCRTLPVYVHYGGIADFSLASINRINIDVDIVKQI